MASAKCLFAVEFTHEGRHTCREHSHGCIELVYFIGCSGNITQDGVRLGYKSGDFLVYQPGQTHDDLQKSSGSQLCVGVLGCGAEKLTSGIFRANQNVADAFLKIREEMSESNPLKADRLDMLAAWLVLEIRGLFGRRAEQKIKVLPYHVAALKKNIDTRFAQSHNLKELTDHIFVNRDYLRHLFRKTVGESPINYLINRRLDAAKELLESTDIPVFQIAEAVGFSNTYYFCRLFKKHSKMTPTDFRRARVR
ncbi:MAG: helix-turn-helix domain-containing protein [Victivallales bacterium]|nr:helix-turn-helix domain-containing protein [Victivallales bacterium]